MDDLIFDAEKLPELLSGAEPLFITMPPDVLDVSDKRGIIRKTASLFNAPVLTYAGSALPVRDVQGLYIKIRGKKYSHVVAAGGGTVMDIAKIIAVALSSDLQNVDIILDDPAGFGNELKLIFIPTTCGTGSEATHFAVVYRDGKKYSVAHRSIKADRVILDHSFLYALPLKVRNATVLDALSQSVEAVWAKNGNSESEKYAQESLKLILKGLDSKDETEKLKFFHKGSHLSGKAINISKTTAAHAISYTLTAKFGIPHGVAVFLTLPYIAEANYCEATHDKFGLLFSLFKTGNIAEFKAVLISIMNSCGFSSKLSDHGISENDLKYIASQSIIPGRSDNNPVPLSEEKVLEILRKNNF